MSVNTQILIIQKHLTWVALIKGCSENMQQIYRRTLMQECAFNKVVKQLWGTASDRCFCKCIQQAYLGTWQTCTSYISAKSSIMDAWQSLKYASVANLHFLEVEESKNGRIKIKNHRTTLLIKSDLPEPVDRTYKILLDFVEFWQKKY